ncbi:hypothetical protein MTO96_003138 [Rhipicephalus appendiculatus]
MSRILQCCTAWAALLLSLARSAQPPNIVMILADDLGWHDVSYHGSDQIPTPNIDVLAMDGVVLANNYVQPLCTPSRASLLTGYYPIHTGTQHSSFRSAQPVGLDPDLKLLPEYLKDLGYSTHMVGKWHLGFSKDEYKPTKPWLRHILRDLQWRSRLLDPLQQGCFVKLLVLPVMMLAYSSSE